MQYADGRQYELPRGWDEVSTEVLDTALDVTLSALDEADASARLRTYYDTDSEYSGTLFSEVGSNDPYDIRVDDLWAVSSLSIPVNARQGRKLLYPGAARTTVLRHLRALDCTLALTDLGHAAAGSGAALGTMWDLHDALRSLLATDERTSTHWVFAAKMCARKRPRLFPVRDTLVCQYLGGGLPLKSGSVRPGDFSVDIQVFAHLLSHPAVRQRLRHLREATTGLHVDGDDLRLLDAVLWTMARWRSQPTSRAPASVDDERSI